MSNKRRLWQIFGPVLCAFILLLVVFLIPWERTFSKQTIYEAAASQNTTVFKGSTMKQEALKMATCHSMVQVSCQDSTHFTLV